MSDLLEKIREARNDDETCDALEEKIRVNSHRKVVAALAKQGLLDVLVSAQTKLNAVGIHEKDFETALGEMAGEGKST